MRERFKRPGLPLVLLVLGYLAVSAYIIAVVSRHYLIQVPNFDQIIFEQAMMSFLDGRGLESTFENANIWHVDHNAVHFQPVLYLLATLYGIYPHSLTIKAIEILLVLGGCIPLFRLATLYLPSRWSAWMVGSIFLLDWALQYQLLSDFHPVNLAIPVYFWALYYLHRGKPRGVLLTAPLGLLLKETEIFTVLMLGIYALAFRRHVRTGITLMVLAVAWFGLVFGLVIPHYNPDGNYVFFQFMTPRLGSDFQDAVQNLVQNPAGMSGELFTSRNFHFLNGLFGRLWYLPLIAIRHLIPALPPLLFMCHSEDAIYKLVNSHLTSPILPFLYVSLVVALSRIRTFTGRHPKLHAGKLMHAVATGLLLFNVYLSCFDKKSIGYGEKEFPAFRNVPESISTVFTGAVPTTDVLASDCVFAPYFMYTHRWLYNYPYQKVSADWLVFYRNPDGGGAVDLEMIHGSLMDGYLPVNEFWRTGHWLMRRSSKDANTDFIRHLRLETERGFDFTLEGESSFESLFTGFSFRGSDGTWSLGNRSILLFSLPYTQDTDIEIHVSGFNPVQYLSDQIITLYLNDLKLDTFIADRPHPDIICTVPFNQVKDGVNFLGFEFARTFQPCELEINADCRILAFKFKSVRFQ
ncbi:DUF2079 domain-containing protein [bacterium]|nr:DUF2079 domain-containing protein [candidate division CSSED10-310 bacterium]